MSLKQPIALVIVLAVYLVWRRHVRLKRNPQRLPLPPGPPRLPLLENLLDIPSQYGWFKFEKWAAQYGDLVYLQGLGSGILTLNTVEAANHLLEKKHDIYCDRPASVMGGELLGLYRATPMIPYGHTWREQRKLMHSALSPQAVKKYHALQEDVIARYLASLIDKPGDFVNQLRLTVGRIIMSVTYGLKADTPDDEYISGAVRAMEMVFKATVPGAWLVDFVPPLKHVPAWFPFASFRTFAAEGRRTHDSMVMRPFMHVKNELRAGTAQPSFTADCLRACEANEGRSKEISDDLILWTAGSMYGAGADTTHGTVLSFILAIALYPDVVKSARAEMDQVVGANRLPSLEDRDNLPYINATIKEALRWKPILPLGLGRRSRRPDFYKGYYIPPGTTVMPNIWTIAVDTKSGIPSSDFAPERFLADRVTETATDPDSYAFGFGRRLCPGKNFAENSLFLLISGILATVDISKEDDQPLDPAFIDGLTSYPEPFKIRIVPRSATAAMLVTQKIESITH